MSFFSFGRKIISFSDGESLLIKVSVTEKSMNGEDEHAFTQRLLHKYDKEKGTMEIVFKNGRPDYAIITAENKKN